MQNHHERTDYIKVELEDEGWVVGRNCTNYILKKEKAQNLKRITLQKENGTLLFQLNCTRKIDIFHLIFLFICFFSLVSVHGSILKSNTFFS